MYVPQCPKCLYHQEHIFTIESSKTGTQWAIERCPHCLYSGWTSNPVPYNEYLKQRRDKHKKDDEDDGRSFWRSYI